MQLQPPSVLCAGTPGSGKTDAIATFIEAGIETFVISTEPDGVGSLIDSMTRRKLDMNMLHWTSCLPATPGWSALGDMITTIGTMGFESIQGIKNGVGKTETRKPAMNLLNSFSNFVCERDGKSYGDVSTWWPDRALVIDSQTGVAMISWMLTLGYKPAAHQGEWGVAMNFIEQLLLKVTSDRNCFFAMTAHIEREVNELTGGMQVMVSTLGRKLAPKIPRFFSEVVLAKKITNVQDKTAKWTWSTTDINMDLKNRSLPIGTELVPSYVPVVEAYRKRFGLAGGTTPQPPGAAVAQQPKAITPPTAPMSPVAQQRT